MTTTEAPVQTYDNRVAFAEELIALAEQDSRIVAVCNDSVGSSNLGGFRERFPDRLINVGIAEQNMVGVGAGLANAGLIPFVCGAGPFLTGRALEQVKADVAYSRLPVILCGMSPGVAYGELGPTHHSIEDYSWLRALPGLDIVVPADRSQTVAAIRSAVENPRPTYIRVGRYKVPDLPSETSTLDRGRFQQLRDGSDVTIIAAGTMVSRALAAADLLEADGTSARVLNAVYLAPLDIDAINDAAGHTRAIVTVEEANVAGGLGAAVASAVVAGADRVPVEILGFREFAPTGSATFLLEYAGLTAPDIHTAALRALSR
ncbi:transketolase family protein [Leifsonia sp. L25]|uniref:transketolase family protein n=1 Tax=Actinomycetes TaxID=1760 RepID=UPI003D69241C